MFVSTQAIVLRTYKYSESSIIAKLYTQEAGLLSFIVHGVRKKKSRYPASFFQALQIIQVEIQLKQKYKLHHIKEISLAKSLYHVHSNVFKSSISLFLAEILTKTIQEEEANSVLFNFLKNSIEFLEDEDEKNISNFHLVFLLDLSRHLGFYPKNNYSLEKTIFNLKTGEYESIIHPNSMHNELLDYQIKNETSFALHQLLESNYSAMTSVKLSTKNRRSLLAEIIRFYQFHLPEMGNIQSLEVLEAVFS